MFLRTDFAKMMLKLLSFFLFGVVGAIDRLPTETSPPLRIKVGKSGRVFASDRLLQAVRNEINAYMAGEIGAFMQEVNQRSSFVQLPGISARDQKNVLFTTQQLRTPPNANINVVSAENVPAIQEQAAYLALRSQTRKLHDNFRTNLLKMKARSVH